LARGYYYLEEDTGSDIHKDHCISSAQELSEKFPEFGRIFEKL